MTCVYVYCAPHHRVLLFFFNDTATTEIYTLSLHDALPICLVRQAGKDKRRMGMVVQPRFKPADVSGLHRLRRLNSFARPDRKSTRLNSSHLVMSYAVFCLKKKTPVYFAAITAVHWPTCVAS